MFWMIFLCYSFCCIGSSECISQRRRTSNRACKQKTQRKRRGWEATTSSSFEEAKGRRSRSSCRSIVSLNHRTHWRRSCETSTRVGREEISCRTCRSIKAAGRRSWWRDWRSWERETKTKCRKRLRSRELPMDSDFTRSWSEFLFNLFLARILSEFVGL